MEQVFWCLPSRGLRHYGFDFGKCGVTVVCFVLGVRGRRYDILSLGG